MPATHAQPLLPLLLLLLCLLGNAASGAGGGAAVVCRYACAAGQRCVAACDADAVAAAALPLRGICTPDDAGGRRCALTASSCDACPHAGPARRRLTQASAGDAAAELAATLQQPSAAEQLAASAAVASAAVSLGVRSGANDTHWLRLRRHAPKQQFDTVQVYILTAVWDAARAVNAHALCGALRPGSCHVIPGWRAAELNESAIAALEADGLITRAPLPPRPRYIEAIPDALKPLFPEYPVNQMGSSHRINAIIAIAAGNAHVLRLMAAAAAAAGADVAARTLYVSLEDDAELGDGSAEAAALFEPRLLALTDVIGPAAWSVLSLTPAPRVCKRSAMLLWYNPATAIVRPRLAFSRTTALVHTADAVRTLVAAMPVDNAVDLWYRALMRRNRLRILLHCGGLVRIGERAKQQA